MSCEHTFLVSEGRRAPYLLVEDLSAGYGGAPIIHGIELRVGLGEVVSILGPNGAGKSTFVKALVGALRVSRGRVWIDGDLVTNLPSDKLAHKGVGYVPQTRDVFEPLTVLENLEMGGYLLKHTIVAERVEEVIAIFPALGQMLKRPAAKLSGGERKMLAVAQVLMGRPKLLILDEPTANLAAELSTALLEGHIRRLANGGTAVLLVEQKAQAALRISDWAYVLEAGTNRLSGPPSDLADAQRLGEVFLGRASEPRS